MTAVLPLPAAVRSTAVVSRPAARHSMVRAVVPRPGTKPGQRQGWAESGRRPCSIPQSPTRTVIATRMSATPCAGRFHEDGLPTKLRLDFALPIYRQSSLRAGRRLQQARDLPRPARQDSTRSATARGPAQIWCHPAIVRGRKPEANPTPRDRPRQVPAWVVFGLNYHGECAIDVGAQRNPTVPLRS